MNRDGRGWDVSRRRGVQVTTNISRHARAVTLSTAAIKTTCQFHSLVGGHLGYSHGLDERRGEEKEQVNGEVILYLVGESDGWGCGLDATRDD